MKLPCRAGWFGLFAGLVGLHCTVAAEADWPMVRGEARHNGFISADLKPPFRLAWVREIERERLGTAVEPILAGNRLLVATHAGNLYALRAESWRGCVALQGARRVPAFAGGGGRVCGGGQHGWRTLRAEP